MTASESWPVDISAGDQAVTDTCVYLPPKALPGIKLPKRLLVRGPGGGVALVGSTRIGGAQDETVIRVSPNLLEKLAPGQENALKVPASLERASWRDVFRHSNREDIVKILTAVVVTVAAIAAAVVAFVTRKVGFYYALGILVLATLAAVLRARGEIRDAVKPKCR
jgi:hypothetical protein